MLKSYAGEKIIQIIKKTMVEFISVESSVFHCLLFQDLLLVMSDVVLVWLEADCSRLLVICSLWLFPADLVGPHCYALLAFHKPRAQEWIMTFNDLRGLAVPSPPAPRGDLWCD